MIVMQYVAFLRAINVGGRAVVKMTDLCAMFERAGAANVRTLIQSGNVLFDMAPRDVAGVVQRAGNALRRSIGAEPEIFLRSVGQLEAMVNHSPFSEFRSGPAIKLYVTFLSRKPKTTPALPLGLLE